MVCLPQIPPKKPLGPPQEAAKKAEEREQHSKATQNVFHPKPSENSVGILWESQHRKQRGENWLKGNAHKEAEYGVDGKGGVENE